MREPNFGFVGAGNLAHAIVSGILKKGNIMPDNIYIYDPDESKTQDLSSRGVRVAANARDLAARCDYIFLTVKPNVYETVLREIAPVLENRCLVDVAAGITTNYVKSAVGFDVPVIRAMPNTPLLVGKGATALVRKPPVTDRQFQTVFDVFASAGFVCETDEEAMDTVTAVSGSGPAYFFRLAKIAVGFAAENGLDSETALRLFAKTMEGAAEMLLNSGDDPDTLIRKVSSPGGTTVAALARFDEKGLDEAFESGLVACRDRARELAGSR